MSRYRKKPVVIEAVQWTGENRQEVWRLFDGTRGGYIADSQSFGQVPGDLYIRTLEGTMHAEVGDWIIRGVADEVYPCKPDVFEATYEAVE
jgi:hypothetical protein